MSGGGGVTGEESLFWRSMMARFLIGLIVFGVIGLLSWLL